MGRKFFVERRELISSWRSICAFLADTWHWQPSELYELDIDELEEWFESAQAISEAKVAAAKAAAR